SGGNLIGEEKWLTEFLNAAVDCRFVQENKDGKSYTYILTNNSSFAYRLRLGTAIYNLEPFRSLNVKCTRDEKSGKIGTPTFSVDNMWHLDYQHPVIEFTIDK
ncbi:MAG: hypothetical protein IKY24_01705, partial [Alistipes sp.]|nr:hypothetical protein [Alistipes sp.]